MDFWKYIDCGFVIVNDTHRDFFTQVIDFYNENAELLRQVEKEWHAGTDQTPVNFLIHDKNVDFKWLPYEFNMCDMVRKEVLGEDMSSPNTSFLTISHMLNSYGNHLKSTFLSCIKKLTGV